MEDICEEIKETIEAKYDSTPSPKKSRNTKSYEQSQKIGIEQPPSFPVDQIGDRRLSKWRINSFQEVQRGSNSGPENQYAIHPDQNIPLFMQKKNSK